MKYVFQVLILSFVSFLAFPTFASTMVIDVTTLSGGDCTELGDYNCTLQEALDVAEGLPDVKINLAEGYYSTDSTFSYTPTDPEAALSIEGEDKELVTISSSSATNMSIVVGGGVEISGVSFFNSPGTGLEILDNVSTTLFDVNISDCKFVSNTNSGLVVENANVAGELEIFDSTFQTNGSTTSGAGLLISSGQALPITLQDNIFFDNTATNDGGGAYIDVSAESSPLIATGNHFDTNTAASGSGGNLYVRQSGANSPIIFGGDSTSAANLVENGTATSEGGGIWLRSLSTSADSYIECVGNTITNNEASGSAGGFMLDSDGEGDVHIEFSDNMVSENSATSSGGGYLYAKAGLVFENNNFSENTAMANGGVWIGLDGNGYAGENTISQNTFSSNESLDDDNAAFNIWISSDDHSLETLTIHANLISENTATNGAVSTIEVNAAFASALAITNNVIVNNTSNEDAGGMAIRSGGAAATIDFVNNTVAGNAANFGAGIYMVPNNFVVNVYNNIFFNNVATTEGDDFYSSANNFNTFDFKNNDFSEICVSNGEDHCNVDLDFSAITTFNGNFVPADNLLDDPLFVSATNFKLSASSPAIGVGDPEAPSLPSFDFNGVALASPPDLGAYKYVAHVPAPAVTLSESSLDFARQTVDTDSDAQSFTLTNTGDATLTITSFEVSGAFSIAETCDETLAADATCEVSVVFSPTEEGYEVGEVIITTDASSSPDLVALSGTGTVTTGNPAHEDESSGGCALQHIQTPGSNMLSFYVMFMASILLVATLRQFGRD